MAKEMPSARSKAFFASFLWPPGQKGWRLAGRDPPVLFGHNNEFKEIKFPICRKTNPTCEPK
jgi:hypothetical protein